MKLTPEQRLVYYMDMVDWWETLSDADEIERLQDDRELIRAAVLAGK